MFRCRLTRIKSTHDRLRSDVVEGTTPVMPDVGNTFFLFAPPLDIREGERRIRTSPIQKVEDHGTHLIFHTLNTTYKFELMP